MNSRETAFARLEAASAHLKTLSYEELQKLAAGLPCSPHSEWRKLQQITVDGKPLHIDVLMGKWGLFRRRISVEVVVNSDDGTITAAVVPCVYFERLKSGQLREPTVTPQRVIVVSIVLVVILVVAVVVF